MTITKQRKSEILADVEKKFEGAKSVVFSGYSGITVKDFSKVRRALREKKVGCKIAKKTLIKIAAKKHGYNDIPDDLMDGPVAALFSYGDEISGAKVIAEMSKKYEALKLLGGLMEGKILSREEVVALSKLASREELLAKMLGSLNAPASGVANSLAGVARKLVYALEAYRAKLAQ